MRHLRNDTVLILYVKSVCIVANTLEDGGLNLALMVGPDASALGRKNTMNYGTENVVA